MSFLKNTVSFIALFSVIPAAYAVTARPSVINTATAMSANGAVRRMPTMTSYVTGAKGGTATASVAAAATTSSLLGSTDCIDAYSECIKGADICGPNFEECTTGILFHAKMPQCLSTLAQCSSDGIKSLFGTADVAALSDVATTNSYGEVASYKYPATGSVLEQLITAAAISNKYDTSTCVKRYTSCLKKDSVCGSDFELCTTNTEFKKQRVYCDSTLARCQGEGVTELLGSSSLTANPTTSSRVGTLIAEGGALAAVNAVSTCYKVVDQCFLGACTANPYKCYENATAGTISLVDAINNGTSITDLAEAMTSVDKSNISAYIKNSCLDTIGSNKYCYATFLGDGMMPTASQLRDEDNQEEIFDAAYSARYNSGMKARVTELVEKFDTRAKEKCAQTLSSCAMRVCGSGSGAACYSQVFGGEDKTINNEYTREEIRTGCASIVNTDANCKYAAQNPNATGTYTYSFNMGDAFDTLFPEYDSGAEADPIGVIASLNASLATNYSDAAIAQMKKQCQSVATSCVKSLCGTDYVNCYRNRTDMYSTLTNSGDASFDKSMNKVGGVLDYTIVLGLCVDTVKNASVCEEHLAIETNKMKIQDKSVGASSWGNSTTVRGGWIDAGGASKMTATTEEVQATDEYGNQLCSNASGEQGVCFNVDANGAVYDKPVMISYTTYAETQAASTLFRDLIYDLEIEAQAKYNAKLTQEQNRCFAMNNGGIMGAKDNGSSYMWVKLKSNKVPNGYTGNGLKANQMVASNDLYGSFCRARVTLHSDDKYIQDAINAGADWATTYFAVGDAFVCGSWIPSDKLKELSEKAGQDARDTKEASQPKIAGWMAAVGALGLGTGGVFLGDYIQNGSKDKGDGLLGGLNQKKNTAVMSNTELKAQKDLCKTRVDAFAKLFSESKTPTESQYQNAENRVLKVFEKFDVVTTSEYDKARAEYNTNTDTSTDVNADKDAFVEEIKNMKAQCDSFTTEMYENAQSIEKEKSQAGEWWDKNGGKLLGGVVGAGAGAGLGYGITKAVQNAELDKAEQEAIQEFMDNVGSKIECYVGGEPAGTYGEVVTITLD